MHKNELKSEAKYTMNTMNPYSIIPVSLKSLKLEILTYICSALVLKFFKLNELLLKQIVKRNDRNQKLKSTSQKYSDALGRIFLRENF